MGKRGFIMKVLTCQRVALSHAVLQVIPSGDVSKVISQRTDTELRAIIEERSLRRGDRYLEIRAADTGPRLRIVVPYIGG